MLVYRVFCHRPVRDPAQWTIICSVYLHIFEAQDRPYMSNGFSRWRLFIARSKFAAGTRRIATGEDLPTRPRQS